MIYIHPFLLNFLWKLLFNCTILHLQDLLTRLQSNESLIKLLIHLKNFVSIKHHITRKCLPFPFIPVTLKMLPLSEDCNKFVETWHTAGFFDFAAKAMPIT